jgi:glucokinase
VTDSAAMPAIVGSNPALRPARLLGDVGGTNARFAWQAHDGAPLEDVIALSTAAHASLADALADYLKTTGRTAPPWCAIGIANPITGDQVQMTNSHWSFSIKAVQQAIGFERLVVINDFTALALALQDLKPADLKQLGGGNSVVGAPLGLIGPGTGLGVSGLVPQDGLGRWTPLQGEGGHVSLAASNAREFALLQIIRDTYGHASAERAVSGMGLETLHAAICKLDGIGGTTHLPAAEVSRCGLANSNPQCVEALALFCSFLGNVAGNLALTLGARGGVYIGGGIVPRLGDYFAASGFRAAFEDKGRFRAYLAPIPVFVIHAEVSPALLGAARAL